MFLAPTYRDNQPLTWFRRMPVYLTTLFTVLMVLGMLVTTILLTCRIDVTPLGFSASEFFHGKVWQPLTAPFISPAGFFFAFCVLFFYMAGVEVEKYIGRKRFSWLLAICLAMPIIVLGICSFWGWHEIYYGPYLLTAAMFIAFATLYPGIQYFSFITLRFLAFAGLLLATMSYLPRHDWQGLTLFWAICGASSGFILFLKRGEALPNPLKIWSRKRKESKFRVLPDPPTQEDAVQSVDALLEKISKSGLSSLSQKERDTLESASKALQKKSR